MPNAPNWTEAQVERLKYLWAQGRSGQQIADDLHTTRNAVLGKVFRLGLPLRKPPAPRPYPKQRKPRIMPLPKPANDQPGKPHLPPEPPRAPRMREVKLIDLEEWHCRWPIGNPHDKDF